MNKPDIAIVGAGLMGMGIATQYILGGHTVIVHDVDENRLREAEAIVNRNFDEMIEAGVIDNNTRSTALSHLVTSQSLSRIGSASIVFEAVPEILSIKQTVYQSIESCVSPNAIIASNTSGFDSGSLSECFAHPERFLVAHFWNPPYLLPLVEIVPASATLATNIQYVKDQLMSIGLAPIVLKKSISGFIGNRVQFAILREVLHLLKLGIASPAEIDMVIQLTLGRRYQFAGPLASADLGGLNTLMEISKHLMPELAKDESVIDVLNQHVQHNEIGIRSGRGFYEWTPDRLEDLKERKRKLLRAGWEV
jgi:3-hydroxybutyryl-CoA dehydrogenase